MRRLLLAVAVAALAGCAVPAVVVPTDPLSPDEHVRLGAAYEREGRPDLAGRSYEAALRRDGQHADALVGLGNLAAGRGDLAEAERRYRRALAVRPSHPDALNNLAWVHLERGRYEEAATLAARALEAAPGRAAYYADTLGTALTRAGRPAEALPALERALAAAPAGNPSLRAEILRHLAETYHALGRPAEADRARAEANGLAGGR